MNLLYNQLTLSATDLSAHLGCQHLTQLSVRVELDELTLPHYDPTLNLLHEKGEEHEAAYLECLRDQRAFSESRYESHAAGAAALWSDTPLQMLVPRQRDLLLGAFLLRRRRPEYLASPGAAHSRLRPRLPPPATRPVAGGRVSGRFVAQRGRRRQLATTRQL